MRGKGTQFYRPQALFQQLYLVMANPGRVLKTRVSGFNFKKPGYPGWVSGFQNVPNWRFLAEKIAKLALFGQKIAKFPCKLPYCRFLVHQMGAMNFLVNYV